VCVCVCVCVCTERQQLQAVESAKVSVEYIMYIHSIFYRKKTALRRRWRS
jgi:hypothetical protein